VDYGLTQGYLEQELGDLVHGFRGYHTLSRLQLRESDLAPSGWTPHVHAGEVPQNRHSFATVATAPFGFLEVLERDLEFDDSHGPRRLGIIFLGADAIAAYDALFCQERGTSRPFAIVLQDHGFGGNYDRFGKGGLLERISRRCGVAPQWLLVGENTDPWDGFQRVVNVEGDLGGMHNQLRFLHERRDGRREQA